jgi:hypothetical protein
LERAYSPDVTIPPSSRLWLVFYPIGPCDRLPTLGARGHSTLDVSVKEGSEELGMGSKGRLLKVIIRLSKLTESSFGRIIEASQRPNHTFPVV